MTISSLLNTINTVVISPIKHGFHTCRITIIDNFFLKIVRKVKFLIMRINNKLKFGPIDPHGKSLAKSYFKKQRELRETSFKTDAEKRRASLGSQPIPSKISIGEFKNTLNEEHSFKDDFNALSRDVQRKLHRKDSLFLSGKLDRDARIDILRNADSFKHIAESDFERFHIDSTGASCPTLDKVHNIYYKPGKDPDISISSLMVRHYMEELKIENIILPRREFWTTADKTIFDDRVKMYEDFKTLEFTQPDDDSAKILSLMIEEGEDDILNRDECDRIYEKIHIGELSADILKDIVTDIVKLSCRIEILDIALYAPWLDSTTTIKIEDHDGKKVVNAMDPEYRSKCRFDNLPLKKIVDAEGKISYKCVLVDLDKVRKPDHTTVETLLRMFPKHQQLIVDIVQETNPELFEGFQENAGTIGYPIYPLEHFLSTRKRIAHNYRTDFDQLD